MCGCVHETKGLKPRGFSAQVITITLSILLAGHRWAQSPSTGTLSGRTLDPSGAAIPGVKIQIMRRDTNVTLSATSDEQGRFGFQLLHPEIMVSKPSSRLSIHFDLTTSTSL